MRRTRRQNERGFALLLVFAMAAAVGVMLYLEMPRVAFEHQRNKEGLLAERGEQYIRAIQLFFKKTNRYPQKIEDLESTNNIRFLRRRYKDPMTGDEEWRLIHVDSAGQYVDSLVHKRAEEKKESAPSVLSSNIIGIGASAEYVPQQGEKTGAAAIRRASDRIIPGAAGGATSGETTTPDAAASEGDQPRSEAPQAQPGGQPGGQPGTNPQGQTGTPFQPPAQGQAIQPGQSPVQPGQAPVQPPGFPPQGVNAQPGGQPGQPIGVTPPTAPAQPSGGFGFGGGFGNAASPNPPATAPNPNQGQRQVGGFPGGGAASGQTGSGFNQGSFGNSPPGGTRNSQGTSNQAVKAIEGMLGNPPRQGGMSGTAGGSASGGPVQGGIVGVASKKDMEGIRLYNERSNYKEWEFLYDRKKALESEGMPGGAQPGQNAQQGTGPNGMQGQGQGQSQSQGSSGSSFGFGSSGGQQQPRPAPGGFGSGSSSGSSFGKGN